MRNPILFICFMLILSSCSAMQRDYYIVPYPNLVEARNGEFDMRTANLEIDKSFDGLARKTIEDFSVKLTNWIGDNEIANNNPVKFIYDASLSPETYTLEIKKNRINISASELNGVLYAIQTLKQLMPVDIYGSRKQSSEWTVPCVKVSDSPRFSYRGMHLDVSRHFFPTDEVKRYLDVMALHKLNAFHWHLTDDQGWRIEIKRYPELTLKGGSRKTTVVGNNSDQYDGVTYGGFYTQDQIREIVEYAAGLGITVIPEIDLPGHMLAALAAYPELGCTGGPYQVWGRWGVAEDVLCAGNDKSFQFVEGVLTEVIDLFPSEYIHIGGDECPKTRWKKCTKCQERIKNLGLKDDNEFDAEHYLQSYVTARVEMFLAEHGRRIIGWDEILEGKLSPDATVMSWRGSEGGIKAAKMGHDVIMTPNSNFYFNYLQGPDPDTEPLGVNYLPVERVYSYDPSLREYLSSDEAVRILGVQANIWTEYIATPEHLEYMLLPRLAALSEVQWCNDDVKEWPRFLNSMRHICDIYSQMGYNFATHIFDIIGTRRVNADKSCVELTLETQGNVPVYYTLDGTDPTTESERYEVPIEIREGCIVKAIVDRKGMKNRMYVKEFTGSKSLGKPAVLNSNPREKYRFSGSTLLTDGIYGPYSYGSGEWIGYQEEPMDVTINMGKTEPYSSVACNMMIQMSDDILPPKSVAVYVSEDNKEFTRVGLIEIPEALPDDTNRIEKYTVNFPPTSAPYIRIVAEIAPEIPEWHPAHGRQAFIFVDEIAVN